MHGKTKDEQFPGSPPPGRGETRQERVRRLIRLVEEAGKDLTEAEKAHILSRLLGQLH